MAVEKKACRQARCQMAHTGECLESLDTAVCPHFYLDRDGRDLETVDTSTRKPVKEGGITLFDGEAFNTTTLSAITSRWDCKYIYLIGFRGAGKTSVLTTILELLQKGPVNNKIFFAGGMTMPGFEQRSHLSRLNSGMSTAETERTKAMEFNYLHLAVKLKEEEQMKAHHFLLSDISGEKIKFSHDSSQVMREMRTLQYGHRIIYIIDGATLANVRERGSVFFDTNMFLEKALANRIFNEHTVLRIVLSKADKLYAAGISLDLEADVFAPIRKRWISRIPRLEFMIIAAKPENPSHTYSFGQGIFELLMDWIKDDVPRRGVLDDAEYDWRKRSFDNFKSI